MKRNAKQFFQKKVFECQTMSNIVIKGCKSSNKEKLRLKMVVKRCLPALRAAPKQLSIPINELP